MSKGFDAILTIFKNFFNELPNFHEILRKVNVTNIYNFEKYNFRHKKPKQILKPYLFDLQNN